MAGADASALLPRPETGYRTVCKSLDESVGSLRSSALHRRLRTQPHRHRQIQALVYCVQCRVAGHTTFSGVESIVCWIGCDTRTHQQLTVNVLPCPDFPSPLPPLTLVCRSQSFHATPGSRHVNNTNVSCRLYEQVSCYTPASDVAMWFMYQPMLMNTDVFDDLNEAQQFCAF